MRPARILPVAAVAVVAVIAAVILLGGGSDTHKLRASFEATEQLSPGQELRIAGRKIGEVGSIDLVDGNAVAELKIYDNDVWPLHVGTKAAIRWGSTTSLAYRYAELYPGPANKPALPDNALLTRSQTITPVELDTSYRIFRGRTKTDLKGLVGELGDTLHGQGPTIHRGLKAAPGGLDQTADFLRQLSADRHALRTLVSSGSKVSTALASREGDLRNVVSHLAATFDEFARHTTAEQRSLDRAPQAFTTATGTLRRLDTSLVGLRALTDDLGPGAVALRTLASPARRALHELRDVVPLATATLRSGRLAGPGLTRLLTKGVDFFPKLSTVVNQLDPMVACLRPYAPELAGMLSTWTGYNRNFDDRGHYARTFPLLANAALIAGTPLNSQQITTLLKGRLFYAMPRPPGLNAGKPWLLPECGAGADALDATKDPEGAGK